MLFIPRKLKAAFELLKDGMISELVLLISKSGHEAECVVAINTSKVGIAWVLLQEIAYRS